MPTYYDEKTKTYYTSFYYKDFNGTTHRKMKRGFKLQREAKEYERSYLAKMQGNTSMLFEDLAKYFLQDLKTRAKPSTYYGYYTSISGRINPTFAKCQLDSITPAQIRNWQLAMKSEGLKNTSIATHHRTLSSVFNYGIKYYGLKENPCTIAGNISNTHTQVMQYWTAQELYSFVKAITPDTVSHMRHTAPFMATAFYTLFYSGIREGELLALTIADYDKTNKELIISKTYTRIGRTDHTTTPKTHKGNRIVPLPDTLCSILDQHILALPDTSTTAPLFPKLSKAILRVAMDKYSKLANVKRIRIHDLRHSHASMLINLGVQPLAISERLGHENIQTTLNIYSHLYPKTANQIAGQLDDIMQNSIKTVSSTQQKHDT